ncbi:MAG: hypothetical protein ACRDA5_11795 [Clostridium sp.]
MLEKFKISKYSFVSFSIYTITIELKSVKLEFKRSIDINCENELCKLNNKGMIIIKKKISVIKTILLTILVFIVIVVGLVSVMFFGNPISKFMAINNYKKYVKETYPNSDFKITKASYNFKDGKYVAEVTSKEKNISFSVSERYDNVITDEYRDLPSLVDYKVGIIFRETIVGEITKEINNINIGDRVQYIAVDMTFSQAKYKEGAKFTKDLNENYKIEISLKNDSNNYIDDVYKIKEIIVNMGYVGLTEIGFQIVDSNYNYEYILLTKDNFNTQKEELINFKTDKETIYDKNTDEAQQLKLQSEIEKSIKDNRILQDVFVYKNKLYGASANLQLSMKILKKTKPTREDLAKETYEIKEIIKNKYPEIKYMNIDYYEYSEENPKGGNWGQYYGSIFIGNEFAPWDINEEDVYIKVKVSEKLY